MYNSHINLHREDTANNKTISHINLHREDTANNETTTDQEKTKNDFVEIRIKNEEVEFDEEPEIEEILHNKKNKSEDEIEQMPSPPRKPIARRFPSSTKDPMMEEGMNWKQRVVNAEMRRTVPLYYSYHPYLSALPDYQRRHRMMSSLVPPPPPPLYCKYMSPVTAKNTTMFQNLLPPSLMLLPKRRPALPPLTQRLLPSPRFEYGHYGHVYNDCKLRCERF